jgi:hypothetical protein
MAQQIYFVRSGPDQSGPFSGQQVKRLAAEGRLKPSDYICQDGSDQWHQVAKVAGLLSAVAPPPVQPPPLPPLLPESLQSFAAPTRDVEQADYRYVLPLLWSLSYALTDKQWRDIRERHKTLYPDWQQCDCPQRCKAKTLDEHWGYDHSHHTKTFLGAKFICNGCHWLKSPGFRLATWRKPPPLASPFVRPPHIIACLGWTQDEVNELQQDDLRRNSQQQINISQIARQIQHGTAVALPLPLERLPSPDIERLIRPGQTVVVPWRVDLTRLSVYGFSTQEIQKFENRMYNLAAKRMQSLEAHDTGLNGDEP